MDSASKHAADNRWADLCLGLVDAGAETRGSGLLQTIRHTPRVKVLSDLLGVPVPRCLPALLTKLGGARLNANACRAIALAVKDEPTRRALCHLDRITPVLAGQLARVPGPFRTRSLLALLNSLEISEAFWGELSEALALMPAEHRGSVEAALKRSKTRGALFDAAAAAWNYAKDNRPFGLPVGQGTLSLKLLNSQSEIEGEGKRMKNCLRNPPADLCFDNVAFAAWHGVEPATVQLVRGPSGWRTISVEGPRNTEVSAATLAEIELAIRQLPVPAEAPAFPGSTSLGFIKALASLAMQPSPQITAVQEALHSIKGQSLPGDNAFCIFDAPSGFIQFLSEPWGEGAVYLCEISSHKYVPEIEGLLNEATFRLIRAAGFSWPRGKNNFARWFYVPEGLSFRELAVFSLVVLKDLFGLPSPDMVKTTVHVPAKAMLDPALDHFTDHVNATIKAEMNHEKSQPTALYNRIGDSPEVQFGMRQHQRDHDRE